MDESELRCNIDRSNRETYCISSSEASLSFSRFKAFFKEGTEYVLYFWTSTCSTSLLTVA